MWSPGNTGRFQCDFSAMLSPLLFDRFELPDLKRLCARHKHSIYHWDGTDALVHEKSILEIDDLDVVQWVPGAGQPMVHKEKWWPLYYRILDAGKRVALVGFDDVDDLVEMRKEFGGDWGHFFLRMTAPVQEVAARIIEACAG